MKLSWWCLPESPHPVHRGMARLSSALLPPRCHSFCGWAEWCPLVVGEVCVSDKADHLAIPLPARRAAPPISCACRFPGGAGAGVQAAAPHLSETHSPASEPVPKAQGKTLKANNPHLKASAVVVFGGCFLKSICTSTLSFLQWVFFTF